MKNYLEYKGYIGTVEFSAEDKIFFGKIQGINDLVTFEGSSVDELEKSFQESILDYLETCVTLLEILEYDFISVFLSVDCTSIFCSK